jgi:hypothetical protein
MASTERGRRVISPAQPPIRDARRGQNPGRMARGCIQQGRRFSAICPALGVRERAHRQWSRKLQLLLLALSRQEAAAVIPSPHHEGTRRQRRLDLCQIQPL